MTEARNKNNEACKRYRKRRREKIKAAIRMLHRNDAGMTYNQIRYMKNRDYYIEKALEYKKEHPVSKEKRAEYNRRYREKQNMYLDVYRENL